jgi:1-acyl-sn-glycerol-3-phosphate acyltransferase
MILLRSLVFVIWFYGALAWFGLAYMPAVLLGHDRYIWHAMRGWGKATIWGLRWICNVRVSFEGLEHLPPAGPALFASKHQAALDTVLPVQFIPEPVFPVKYELTRVPVFGFYMTRMIPLKRETHAQALKSLVRAAREVIAKGRQIVIYPEGTRQELSAPPDYKPGIAAMYKDLGLPVTPIALNTGLVWGPKGIIRKPGHVTIKFLPAIPAGLSREQFMARLQEAIESECQALLPEPLRRKQPA